MLSRPTLHRLSRRNLLKLGGAAAAAGAFGFRPGESFADGDPPPEKAKQPDRGGDRKSTRLNSSHTVISYAVFCLKKKKKKKKKQTTTKKQNRKKITKSGGVST